MESLPPLTIFTGVPWLRYPCRMEFYYVSNQPGSIPQKLVFLKCKKLALPPFSCSFISEFFSVSIRTRNIHFNFLNAYAKLRLGQKCPLALGKMDVNPILYKEFQRCPDPRTALFWDRVDLPECHGLDKRSLEINNNNNSKKGENKVIFYSKYFPSSEGLLNSWTQCKSSGVP